MGVSESRDTKRYSKDISKSEKKIIPSKDICAICLEPMIDYIIWLPCTHSYHADCLNKWENKCREKKRNITCAICSNEY
jgi:hypothetical protein